MAAQGMGSGALAKLAAAAAVLVVLLLARLGHHRSEPGVETFRYPAIFFWCALAGAIFFGGLPLGLFTATGAGVEQVPLPWMRVFLCLMPWYLWLIAGMCAWGAAFLRLPRIEVRPDEIVVQDVRSMHSIDPRDVRRCVEYLGRGSGLVLYDEAGQPLLRVSGLIRDYQGLVDLIRRALPADAVDYEKRTRSGLRID
jgi:hypothetical protein